MLQPRIRHTNHDIFSPVAKKFVGINLKIKIQNNRIIKKLYRNLQNFSKKKKKKNRVTFRNQ